jgi:signal peptidase II
LLSKKISRFLVSFGGSVLLDQVTKALVYNYLAPWGTPNARTEITVIPHLFSIVHRQNEAAAAGLLAGNESRFIFFAAFSIVAGAVSLFLLYRLPKNDGFTAAILGLILAGAAGNSIDRLHKRSVTDFLKVYIDTPESAKNWLIAQPPFHTNEWPTFNIADSSLVVGVLLFLAHFVFAEEEEDVPAPMPGAPAPDQEAP